MARTNVVNKSRVEQRCSRCGETIPVGRPYRFQKQRTSYKGTGLKVVRCFEQACRFRPSQTTRNDKLATVYGAQEALEDVKYDGTVEGLDEVIAELESAMSQAEEAVGEFGESADNIEEHFGETDQVSEIREQAEQAEAWRQALDAAKDDVESFKAEAEEAVDEAKGNDPDTDDEPDPEWLETELEKLEQVRRDHVTDTIENVLSEQQL